MAIALRQDTTGSSFSETTLSGSLLVLVCSSFATNTTNASTITFTPSTSGFTWTEGIEDSYQYITVSDPTTKYDTGTVAIYYIQNASAMSSGTTTSVSVSFGSSASINMYEFTGVASSAVDSTAYQDDSIDSSETVTAGNISTSSGDLIVVGSTHSGTAGSGYSGGPSGESQYLIGASGGSVSTAFGSSATLWAAVAMSFKSSSVSGNADATTIDGSFSTGTATTQAGSQVPTTGTTGTFAEGTALPGGANQSVTATGVSATFAVANITADFPINYGNVVSGSNTIPGAVNSTYFYARWTGWLTVYTPGYYVIGLNVQDGADLYLNSSPIVNALAATQSANSALAYTNGTEIYLAANIPYQLVLEWQHGTGSDYQIQLIWTPPGATAPVLIPPSNLNVSGAWWNGTSSSWYPNSWYVGSAMPPVKGTIRRSPPLN